jgi:hypothetical protein
MPQVFSHRAARDRGKVSAAIAAGASPELTCIH